MDGSGFQFQPSKHVTRANSSGAAADSADSLLPVFTRVSAEGESASAGAGLSVRVSHRYPFTSTLKRMSVIADVAFDSKTQQRYVLTKGAPEVLANHLVKLPSNYQSTYLYHMCKVCWRQFHNIVTVFRCMDVNCRLITSESFPFSVTHSSLSACGQRETYAIARPWFHLRLEKQHLILVE